MTIKIYENNEIYVRPFIESDITERYLEWFHDQEVCKYNSHGKMSNMPILQTSDARDSIGWAIVLKRKYDTDSKSAWVPDFLIGKVKLEINWINRNAEFTCIFGEKEYWGKGYCTQVLKWMIEHSFNKLGLNKIWLGTALENIGMQKAAERAGMYEECILEQDLFLNGQFTNTIRWCVTYD